MEDVRPLREVFDALAGGEFGASSPFRVHQDLPDDLLTEAIISYADTAPAEVAAHLAPFVTAHGPVPSAAPAGQHGDVAHALDLLAGAPVGLALGEPYAAEEVDETDDLDEPVPSAATGYPAPDPIELGFGHGHEALADADHSQAAEEGLDWGSHSDPDDGWSVAAEDPIGMGAPDHVGDELAFGTSVEQPDDDGRPDADDADHGDALDA